MELRQLEMLRELGALGSITAVAQALLITPSAVSQQLSQLQRSVDVPLTRREGRNLVLTEAGQVLSSAGVAVITAMAEARTAIGSYHNSLSTPVTVSGFHSAAQVLFAPLLEYLDASAGPEVLFSDEDVAQAEFPALTAHYDLVLAHRMDHSPRWPTRTVSVIPLVHEPLDVALSAGHRLAEHRTLTVDDVVNENWVTSHSGFSPADILSAIAAMTSTELRISHRVNDYSTVATLVATGNVIGLLPRYTAQPMVSSGIVLRPIQGISTYRTIDILARPESLKRTAVIAVCDALQSVMARLTA